MMSYLSFYLDMVVYLTISTTVLFYMVVSGKVVWFIFGIGGLWTFVSLRAAATATISNVKQQKWEAGFSDWFNVVKFLTAGLGVLLLNIFRQAGWYSKTTHHVVVFLLSLNIFEAVYRDIELKYYFNVFSGLSLIFMVIYSTPDFNLLIDLKEETITNHIFVFPLSSTWIFLYTTWNACFTYGNNLSWLTRLTLVPPIILCFLFGEKIWLGARVLLLTLHLILRSIQIIWLYQPGMSYLTPVAGSINNSKGVCNYWGFLNFLMTLSMLLLS